MNILSVDPVREILEVRTDEGTFVLVPKLSLLNEGVCSTIDSPVRLPAETLMVAFDLDQPDEREEVTVPNAITAQSHPQLIALARRYFASLPLDINLTEEQARAELEAGVPGFFRGVG